MPCLVIFALNLEKQVDCLLKVFFSFGVKKTFSGKIHRHKIYRKSLNKASDFECISDEPLIPISVFTDTATVNRNYNNLGQFYNNYHINTYYYPSSDYITLSNNSTYKLNSMDIVVDNALNGNLHRSQYIILKNNSSLSSSMVYKSAYVPYNSSQDLSQVGAAYDSNFIHLYNNADYLFSADLEITPSASNSDASLVFYLTGSYNTGSNSANEPLYVNGKGIKLAEYKVNAGTGLKRFSVANDSSIISFVNDYIGTLTIVPINISKINISNLSLTPNYSFGFSPDTFTARIPFPVSVANELYELKFELFDINQNSIYSNLRTVGNFDIYGETLIKNSPINLVSYSASYAVSASYASNGGGGGGTTLETGSTYPITRDRKSTRLNSSHIPLSRMPSSA